MNASSGVSQKAINPHLRSDKKILHHGYMQSQSSTKKSKQNHPRLPWGMGSAVLRCGSYYLAYRTPDGEVCYENSGTDDPAEAQRIMAERALPRARALVATLERIANGKTRQAPDQGKSGKRPRSGSVAPVGTALIAATRKAGSTGRRGGKA